MPKKPTEAAPEAAIAPETDAIAADLARKPYGHPRVARPAPKADAPEATPAAVSDAASTLGRRARGVPKTITEERREELRTAAAHARGFRVKARPAVAPAPTTAATATAPAPSLAPPTTGRRIAAKPVVPAGRRVASRIVAPTPGDVAAFGRG